MSRQQQNPVPEDADDRAEGEASRDPRTGSAVVTGAPDPGTGEDSSTDEGDSGRAPAVPGRGSTPSGGGNPGGPAAGTGESGTGTGSTGQETVDRAIILGAGARWLSDWALRLSILIVAGWLLYQIGGTLWSGVLPVLLALIVSTVLWTPVRWMTDHGVPKALAAMVAVVGSLVVVLGVLAAIAPSIVGQASALGDSTAQGIRQVQDWLQGPPLNIRDEQLNTVVDKVTQSLQSRTDAIANGVFTGVTVVGSALVTLVLVLVLSFFFVKDGRSFLPWVRSIVGHRTGLHATEVLTRSWNTLGGYIRAQAIVSLVDAVCIGFGLIVLGVPLAWALAVITFLGGFIPIIGAFTAGAVAVLVALVTKGFTTALIVLIIVIAVQQLEGNVLSPMLQSRAMELHPGIVLLVVAAGGTLYGIIGAFLAVPVAAVTAVVLRYLGEQVDLRSGVKTAADVHAATAEGRLTALGGELGRRRLVPDRVRRSPGEAVGATASTSDETGQRDQTAAAPAPGRLARVVGGVRARLRSGKAE